MFNLSKVVCELEIFPEDMEVRGNAICSGDDDFDREVEDGIISRLEEGDLWAWCTVKVTARYRGVRGLKGVAWLGGCSYLDSLDFRKGGYFEDMRAEAIANLRGQMEEIAEIF